MRVFSLLVALVIVAAFFVASVIATNGGDVSQLFSVDAWRCARQNGWDFAIVRGYMEDGNIDPNGLQSLANIKAAGIPYHDIYHFPCLGKSAAQQVQETYDHYKGWLTTGSMLWFDVESPGPSCGFLGELIAAAKSLGIHAGVYTSPYEWQITVSDSCRVGADNGLPLWWADYNGEPGFEGFSPLGGWTKPAIHQWEGTTSFCGMSVDKNWYP